MSSASPLSAYSVDNMSATAPLLAQANNRKSGTTARPAQSGSKKPGTAAKPAQSGAKKPAAKPKKKATTSGKGRAKTRADYERDQKNLQRQIKETERMISNNEQSVRDQRRDIRLREEELNKRRALIATMQQEIEVYHLDEDSLRALIAQLDRNFTAGQQRYAEAVRHVMQWRASDHGLLYVLSAHTMGESLRRVRYLRDYSQWRRQQAEDLRDERNRLHETRNALLQVRAEREALMASLHQEERNLAAKQQQQQRAVDALQKKGKELQAELERDQKRQREVQARIQTMIEEERRKAEEARRKAEAEARRKAEAAKKRAAATASSSAGGKSTPSASQGKAGNSAASGAAVRHDDDSWKRLTGSFRQNKGRLPSPVSSSYAILQHYSPAQSGNVGITLSASVGASAMSVYEGTVLRISRSSEEYTIIVQHGDYMSVYSNLGSVSVAGGQKVAIRQKLGQLKTDLSGSHSELRFWIYGKTDAENPEAWLKR